MARRNPGVTLLAVATLALGVGSTTAIFSVFKAVLFNQLPYRDPDRVVALSQRDPTAPGIELDQRMDRSGVANASKRLRKYFAVRRCKPNVGR